LRQQCAEFVSRRSGGGDNCCHDSLQVLNI